MANEDSKPRFYCIDNDTLRTHGAAMGLAGVAVYNVLVMHANADNECWPSYQTIAGMLGVSRPTVIKAIGTLIEIGLISKAERRVDNRQSSNVYRIRGKESLPQREIGVNEIDYPSQNSLPPPVKNFDPPSKESLPEVNPIEKEPIEQNQRKEKRAHTRKTVRVESPHFSADDFDERGFVPSGSGRNAVQVYYERADIRHDRARLTAIQEDDLIRACEDLDRLRLVMVAYSQTNYRPGNLKLILDWYQAGVPERHSTGESNGAHRQVFTEQGTGAEANTGGTNGTGGVHSTIRKNPLRPKGSVGEYAAAALAIRAAQKSARNAPATGGTEVSAQ